MIVDLPTVQNYETEILREIVRICEKRDIPYYMFYGSLLGTVRHKGTIPWDGDVDIAVPEDMYERFSQALDQELDSRFWWDFRQADADPRCFGRVGLAGYDTYYLHVDVYRLIGYSGNARKDARISSFGHLLLRLRLVKTVNPIVYRKKKRILTKILKVLLAPLPTMSIVKRFDRICGRFPYASAPVVGTLDGPGYLIDKAWLEDWEYGEYEGMQVRIPSMYDKVLTKLYGDYMTPPPGVEKNNYTEERRSILER